MGLLPWGMHCSPRLLFERASWAVGMHWVNIYNLVHAVNIHEASG